MIVIVNGKEFRDLDQRSMFKARKIIVVHDDGAIEVYKDHDQDPGKTERELQVQVQEILTREEVLRVMMSP